VGRHVALEVEVGELAVLLNVEKLAKSRVGVNLAAVLGVLEIVSTNVLVNLAGHLSASHLSTSGLAEEGGESITNGSGLHKTTGIAITSGLTNLLAALLGSAKLLLRAALELADLGSETSEKSANRGELSDDLVKLLREGEARLNSNSLCLNGNRCGSRSGNNNGRRSGNLGSGSSSGGLRGLGGAGSLGGSSSLRGSSVRRHLCSGYD
jgi:hypothetical protein